MNSLYASSRSPITFPGLFGDWQFTADPKALDIGNGIYWYGIIITVGLMLAVLFCLKKAPEYGLTEDNVLDMAIWGVPMSLLGARLYYVIFYLDRFMDESGKFSFQKAIAVWDGGLAIYGAVIAAFLTAVFVSKAKKFKLGAMADLGVMGLLIGQSIGRWGNFVNREAFGGLTDLPWRMGLWTTAGQYIEVHPTFLYESLWNAVGLAMIVFVISKARHFDGENTWFYFMWYGLGRFWIEGLRTDSLYLFDWQIFGAPIRVSQALSFVMFVLSAAMLFYHLKLRPHSREELFVEQVAARKAAEETAAECTDPVKEEVVAEDEFAPAEEAEGDSDGGEE